MTSTKDARLVVRVARLYYEDGLTQQQIAHTLGLSEPTVCRLMAEARAQGIVSVSVIPGPGEDHGLAEAVAEAFGLSRVIVATGGVCAAGAGAGAGGPGPGGAGTPVGSRGDATARPGDDAGVPATGGQEQLKQRLGELAASYLSRTLRAGQLVGVSWGTTLLEVALRLKARPVSGLRVVQLNGSVGMAEANFMGVQVVLTMARKLGAGAFLLPAPAIVETPDVRRALEQDSSVARALELGRSADVAVFTVGTPSPGSVLVAAGYVTREGLESLVRRGAVGDICSRFINEGGEVCDPELDARTIGLRLEDLKRIPERVLVAGGPEKIRGLAGALAKGYATTLITDERSAEALLAMRSQTRRSETRREGVASVAGGCAGDSAARGRVVRNQARLSAVVRAARMYNEAGMRQEEIAKELGVSRPSVSRYLKVARERGIVSVTIYDPEQSCSELTDVLRATFGLKQVMVVPNASGDEKVIKAKLGKAAADYLRGVCRDGDVIGVSWGTTLDAVAERLVHCRLRNTRVVQLNGSLPRTELNETAARILLAFATAFCARSHALPVPAVVDSPDVKAAVLSDARVREVLDLAANTTVAVYSVGVPGPMSVLYEAGYFSASELSDLIGRGAVGDVCSRYLNHRGELVDPDLDRRTIGVELDQLRACPRSVAVAGGAYKARGILAALRSRVCNVLITDETAAREVLRLAAKG